MEARIELELRGKKPSEITELILDNCNVTKVSGLTDEYVNLSTLSMINMGLTTLDGLPRLDLLRTIDLSDNKLTGNLDILAEKCPRLYHINLCANKIKDISVLTPLQKLEELSALDLFDCEVTEVGGYRQKVFELIPQLKYLDGFDMNDVEAELSDDGSGEDALGEDADLSDEELLDEEDETGIGLSYLGSSKVQDEDESEDFVADAEPAQNGKANNNGANTADEQQKSRGLKRKHEENGGDEEPTANGNGNDDGAVAEKEAKTSS